MTLVYLGFVGWVTLTPGAEAPTSSGLAMRVLARLQRSEHLSWLTYDRAEYLANIALFVPVGLFLLLMFGTRLWWLAGAAARDSVLETDVEPVQRDYWRGRIVAVTTTLLLAGGLYAGKIRWQKMDREFRNNALYKPVTVATSIRTNLSSSMPSLSR